MNWGEQGLTAGWRTVERPSTRSSPSRNNGRTTVDIDTGFQPGITILVAALLVSAIGYVVARTVLAHRRGDDAGQAATSAARAVGPPLAIAVFSLVALSVLASVAAVFFLIAVIAALAGNTETLGNLVLVWLIGSALLLVALVAAVAWGVVRVLRLRRERG